MINKWLMFLILLISIGCEPDRSDYVKIEASIIDFKNELYSMSFSTKGGTGYYRQRIFISYNVDGSQYFGNFLADRSLGVFHETNKVLINIGDDPLDFEVVAKVQAPFRKKNPPVKGTAK